MSDTSKRELGRELSIGRLLRASCWALLLQICLLLVWCACLSPLSGPSGWLLALRWWHPPLLLLVVAAQAVISCNDFLVKPRLHTTRLKLMVGFFTFHNLVSLSLYMFVGAALVRVYVSSSGGPGLWSLCEHRPRSHCLREDQFFLSLSGPFLGLYCFLNSYLLVIRLFRFPIIQQCKFAHLKSKLSRLIGISIRHASAPVSIYIILYYVWGNSARDWFCGLFSVAPPSDPMNSFFSMLRPSVLSCFWLMSFLFGVSMRLTELLFNIWLTEHHVFPLIPDGALTLSDALDEDSPPIVRHLAFLDLFLLSSKNRDRRDLVFKLSQPGGHPHTWNGIKAQCFALIDDFILELEKAMKPLRDEPGIRLVPRPIRIYHGEQPSSDGLTDVPHPSMGNHLDPFEKMFIDLRDSSILKWYEIKRVPILAYFVGELPESRIDHLLLGGQQVIWAAHSLSHLACHSLSEDGYGVMQNDLPQVMASLLRLKTTLDSVVKHGGLLKKSPKQDVFPIRMRNAVRASVKRSIYRLAIHFKAYISDLQLSKETEHQMLTFISFKAI